LKICYLILPKTISYKGMIGCCSVPNNTLIVRRNGMVCVSGNSFESLYQAIRRSYRFGQKKEVNIYLITTDTMQNVIDSIKTKEQQFKEMQKYMIEDIKKISSSDFCHNGGFNYELVEQLIKKHFN